MLKPCVGNYQLIAITKVQQLFTIFITLTSVMRTNDQIPSGMVRAHTGIEITQYDGDEKWHINWQDFKAIKDGILVDLVHLEH